MASDRDLVAMGAYIKSYIGFHNEDLEVDLLMSKWPKISS